MTDINLIKELRTMTGAGVAACKDALQQCNDNIEDAKTYLRKASVINAQSKAHVVAQAGVVGMYHHPNNRMGAMVELRCETDLVSCSQDFITLAKEIALHIAGANPLYVSRQDVPQDVINGEREIAAVGLDNKPQNIRDKIILGRLDKFYESTCLIEQEYLPDPSKTIQDMVDALVVACKENITVKQFSRFAI